MKGLIWIACLVLVAMMGLGTSEVQAQGRAQAATTEQRTEFFKLQAERDRLYTQKYTLVQQAAAQKSQGQEPLELYARIESVQSQIDIKEHRLNQLSIQHGLPLKPAPTQESIDRSNKPTDPASYFKGGKGAVDGMLKSKATRFLKALSFRQFLGE